MRQVGYLQGLYRDALSTEYKILVGVYNVPMWLHVFIYLCLYRFVLKQNSAVDLFKVFLAE